MRDADFEFLARQQDKRRERYGEPTITQLAGDLARAIIQETPMTEDKPRGRVEDVLVVPRVHLNGTGKHGLITQISDAYRVLESAIAHLGATSPHMRDYYIMDDAHEVYQMALAQHVRRMQKLYEVREELQDMLDKIFNQ